MTFFLYWNVAVWLCKFNQIVELRSKYYYTIQFGANESTHNANISCNGFLNGMKQKRCKSIKCIRKTRNSVRATEKNKNEGVTSIQVLNCHISHISLPIFRTICILNMSRHISQSNRWIVYITICAQMRIGRMPFTNK